MVAFEIEAAAIANVGVAQLAMEIDRGGASLGRWAEYMREAPRELTAMLTLFADGHTLVAQTTAVVASDDVELISRAIGPLLDTGVRLLGQQAQVAPYTLLMPTGHLHPNLAQQPVTTTSGFLPTFTTASARAVMDAVVHPAGPLVQLRSLGGAINDVDPAETAYRHRHQEILAVVSIFPPGGGAELDRAWSLVAPHTVGSYQNFESRPDAQSHARAFPGETGRRIAELRARFDPDGVFRPPVSAG